MAVLGEWIKEKYGSQAAFAEAMGVTQSRVSKWLSGYEPVPDAFQKKLVGLKYKGPWPREEAQEAPAPAAGAYVTREEYGELVGRLKRLEEDFRALLPLAVAVKDLDERVRKLAGDPESRG